LVPGRTRGRVRPKPGPRGEKNIGGTVCPRRGGTGGTPPPGPAPCAAQGPSDLRWICHVLAPWSGSESSGGGGPPFSSGKICPAGKKRGFLAFFPCLNLPPLGGNGLFFSLPQGGPEPHNVETIVPLLGKKKKKRVHVETSGPGRPSGTFPLGEKACGSRMGPMAAAQGATIAEAARTCPNKRKKAAARASAGWRAPLGSSGRICFLGRQGTPPAKGPGAILPWETLGVGQAARLSRWLGGQKAPGFRDGSVSGGSTSALGRRARGRAG